MNKRITLSGPGWASWGNYDYNHGVPQVQENDGGSIGYYDSVPANYQWKHYVSNPEDPEGSAKYSYSYSKTAIVEYKFSGTNTTIKTIICYNRGITKISIYKIIDMTSIPLNDPANLELRDTAEIDNYNSVFDYKEWKFNALESDNYLVRMQPTGRKNELSNNYIMDFDSAKTYPAIQYIDSGQEALNIGYKALRYNSNGYVEVTPDGERAKTVEVDLYSPVDEYKYVKVFKFDENEYLSPNPNPSLPPIKKPHRLTIEATSKKNPSSNGNRINLDAFGALPQVSTSMSAEDINLIALKNSTQGFMELYVDDKRQNTFLNLNESTERFAQGITTIAYNNDPHRITFVSTYDTPSSPGGKINIDAITRVDNEAIFTFKTNTDTNTIYMQNTGQLLHRVTLNAVKGPDQGKFNVYLDGVLKTSTPLDLFSATVNPPKSLLNFTIDNISSGTHTLVVKPAFQKNPASTGFKINVDNIKLEHADSVCTPQ